jgi:hypothetical protein
MDSAMFAFGLAILTSVVRAKMRIFGSPHGQEVLIRSFLTSCEALSLTLFHSAHYSLDQTRILNCVVKAGYAVGPGTVIPDKMSIDLSHVDGGSHETAGGRGFVGYRERNIRRQLEIPSLTAIRMIAG